MRHTIPLRDDRDRPAEAQLDIRMDTVELRCPSRPMASTSRLFLTGWLDDPYLTFPIDECTLYDTNPITLTIGPYTGHLTDELLRAIRDDLRGAE